MGAKRRWIDAAVAAYGKPVAAAHAGEKLMINGMAIEVLAASDETIKDITPSAWQHV